MVRRGLRIGMTIACLLALLLGSPVQAQESSRFFPESGKTVRQPFLGYWLQNGGLVQQGYPITDEFDEANATDGKTYRTQYFERARFEFHPEQRDPRFQVLLGLLGRESLQARYPGGRVTEPRETVPGGGGRTFAETGRTVEGLFLTYWQNNGGLAQQGLPLTDAFYEMSQTDGKRYVTQYFERARFEYHPEQPDARYRVLLGLLGKEIYQRRESGNPPPAQCQAVKQIFEYAVNSNSDLKNRLGCALDRGFDAADGTHGGYQPFRRGEILINQSDTRPSYGFGLYPDGSFRRVGYIGQSGRGSGDPPLPGPRSASVYGALGPESLGAARDEEDFGDGAVQRFQKGTLYYVGSQTQLVFAVFPNDADSGTWAKYASRP